MSSKRNSKKIVNSLKTFEIVIDSNRNTKVGRVFSDNRELIIKFNHEVIKVSLNLSSQIPLQSSTREIRTESGIIEMCENINEKRFQVPIRFDRKQSEESHVKSGRQYMSLRNLRVIIEYTIF